jgi:hypothetical protein
MACQDLKDLELSILEPSLRCLRPLTRDGNVLIRAAFGKRMPVRAMVVILYTQLQFVHLEESVTTAMTVKRYITDEVEQRVM